MARSSTTYGAENGLDPAENGRKGHAGKGDKPEAFKAFMRELASRRETMERLKTQLESKDDKVFLDAFREVANRGYGKATEHVEHSGSVNLSNEQRMDRLAAILNG